MVNKDSCTVSYKPYCRTCDYRIESQNFLITEIVEYRNVITRRKAKLRVKPRGLFCNHPNMYTGKNKPAKVNKNHIRWWGFTPECPFNPYSHTCGNCGKRMASGNTVCSSCEKILNTMMK